VLKVAHKVCNWKLVFKLEDDYGAIVKGARG
jgi:hypothetical protein